MMTRKTVTFFAVIAMLCMGTAQAAEVFSFNTHSDGADFNGAIDAPSDSGDYSLTTVAPTFLQENGSVVFMYRAGSPSGETISSEMKVLDTAFTPQLFNVNSIDWRAFSGSGEGTLTGFLGGTGGTQQWQLAGPEDLDPPATFGSPTTGNFGSTIDTILWSVANYPDNTFGNTMDNVNINIVPEPATLGLLGLSGIALLASRKRRLNG